MVRLSVHCLLPPARAVALVLLAPWACRDVPETPGEDCVAPAATLVTGAVAGPEGEPLAEAPVRVAAVDPATGSLEYLDETRTDAAGAFALASARTGTHRVEAGFPGMHAAAAPVVVAPDAGEVRVDLRLAPVETVTLRGIVLDADGRPLDEEAMAFLLPELAGHDELLPSLGSDGVPEVFPFTGGSDLVVRLAEGGAPFGGDPLRVDLLRGTFEVDVPAGSSGTIVLRFRGNDAASAPFAPGARMLELWVDVAALRGGLARLEVLRTLGAGTRVTLYGARLAQHGGAPLREWGLVDVPPRLRLIGLPPGRYGFVLQGDQGAALQDLSLAPGDQRVLELAPAPHARVQVRLDGGADGRWLAQHVADVHIRTPAGQRIDATPRLLSRGGGMQWEARFEALPAGDLVLHAAASALPVHLTSGENTVTFRLEPPHTYYLRYPAPAAPAAILDGTIALLQADGTFVRAERRGVTPVAGTLEVPVLAVPGRYLAVAEFPGALSRRDEIELHAGSEVVVLQ